MAVSQLIKTIRANPDLTIDGWQTSAPKQRSAELLGSYDSFGDVLAWMATAEARRAIRRSGFSYSLKHDCQRATGGFVSNGLLIAAALASGMKVHRLRNSLNARIRPGDHA